MSDSPTDALLHIEERYDVLTTLGSVEVSAGTVFPAGDSAVFSYHRDYLANERAYALAPALPLVPGPQYLTGLGPFSDSAPDRWGRKLLQRAAKRTHLTEYQYLFGVADHGRQGAVRFRDAQGTAVAHTSDIPAERDLADLLSVADRVQRGDRNIPDILTRRLAYASGSLGGARPKANIRKGEMLWLAKFPKAHGEQWDVTGWEATVLALQAELHILVPEHSAVSLTDTDGIHRTVLLLRRFDRRPATQVRIGYISAMTALESADGDGGDWLDLVEFSREHGADTFELWRRAALGTLIGNRDNHLRNHGFLRQQRAWHLSPAFDVNPTPLDQGNSAELSLFGESDLRLSHLLAAEALDLFAVRADQARQWCAEAAQAFANISRLAQQKHVDADSIEIMHDRFADALAQAHDAL